MKLEQNVSLRSYNTFGIEATARYHIWLREASDLQEIDFPAFEKNLLVLGGGSNVLFTRDWPGLVIHMALKGIRVEQEDADSLTLFAAAGEVWNDLVQFAIERNAGGIENLIRIPGLCGAAPMQNIGAYGCEIRDTLHSVDAFHIPSGAMRTFSNADCRFGYRESYFKNEGRGQYIITGIRLRLSKHPRLNIAYGAIREALEAGGKTEWTIADVAAAVSEIRRSKLPDPTIIGNAGSFFKNPEISMSVFEKLKAKYPAMPSYPLSDSEVKVPAGWLIEQAGWKGKRAGNCGVHDKQALVLVNYGGASGMEIYALSQQILESVQAQFGILLQREVNII